MIGFRWCRITIVVFAVFLFVSPAAGRMIVLDDEALADAYAGTTLAVWAPIVDLAMGFDALNFTDSDGTGDARTGSVTLEGFSLIGSVAMKTPLTMKMGSLVSLINGHPQEGLDLAIDEMTIRIDRLAIDAIRVGYGPGPGESFGSIAVSNWVTRISGRIQIYTY